MSQALAGELRALAGRVCEDPRAAGAGATREFWRLAREFRAAMPPLLLPHRGGSSAARIGYLASPSTLAGNDWPSLSREHGAGEDEVWVYALGPASGPSGIAGARTVELTRYGELQAARMIADADLDVLVDLDGAALRSMPLLVALRPSRAMIEPMFEPASAGGSPGTDAIPDTPASAPSLARLARAVAARFAAAGTSGGEASAQATAPLHAAIRAHQAGRLEAARAAYDALLARFPGHPVAAYMLGQLLHQQGHAADSIAWLQRACQAAPEFRDAHYTLGQRLADAGRREEAVAAYGSAVELTPAFAAGWSGLGLAIGRDRRAHGPSAVECLERAVALEPEAAEWRFNLGTVLQHGGDLAGARRVYEGLLAGVPGHVASGFNLATVAQELGDYPAAIAGYRAVLRQQPGFAAVYPQLGACLQLTGQVDAWLDNFGKYRAACPESLPMAAYGLEASVAAGDPAAYAAWRDRLLAGAFPAADREEFTRCWEQLLFLLLHVDLDRAILRDWYERYDAEAVAHYGAPVGFPQARRPGRARIGYLSGDLREHVMGRMIHRWVSGHDRSRCDITLYSLSAQRDAWTGRFEALGVPIVDLWSMPHDRAAARIRQDDLDLLIDCCGHTRGAQPGILALKPARVIATHIATPGPVGLRAVDYKLTEALAESDDAQQFVLERLLPVAGGVFPWRRYAAAAALSRQQLGIAPGAFVCGAFVSLMKLSPRCLQLWRRVLAQVPRAVLALSPPQASLRQGYLRWMGANGIEPGRIVFIPCPADEAGQLARYRVLDIALDPLPCGNVNGTMEALAMGVPVATLVGPRHGERLGNALLTRFGLTETIARDADGYVGIVQRMANDAAWADQVRARIARLLVDSPVWDNGAHVRGLEAAFDRMLEERGVKVAPE